MIEEAPSQVLAYRFTHELVRRARYDRMPALHRAELHLRVAETLERTRRPGDTRDLAELAHHFGAAAPVDGPRRAVEYSLLAGRAALESLDFDEAESRFSYALELGIDDPRERAETQLELGTARFRGGRSDTAIVAFGAAAQIARELGDQQLLGTAAVGFEEACWRPAIHDAGAVELLEEAVFANEPEDSALLVMLLSGLSRARGAAGDYPGATLAEETQAIAMARRLHDMLGLATVLMRSYWARLDRDGEEILEMMAEAREIAEDLGQIELQADAMVWRVAALMDVGDLRAAQRELAEVHALAARQRQPFALHVAEHYAATILALDRKGHRGRDRGDRVTRVEPPAVGAARLGRARHPDVLDPARAGTARRACGGHPTACAARRLGRRLAPGVRGAARRAGDGIGGAPRARARPRAGL